MLEGGINLSGVRPGEDWREVAFQTVANRLRKSRPLWRLREVHAAAPPFRHPERIYSRPVCRPDQTRLAFSLCFQSLHSCSRSGGAIFNKSYCTTQLKTTRSERGVQKEYVAR